METVQRLDASRLVEMFKRIALVFSFPIKIEFRSREDMDRFSQYLERSRSSQALSGLNDVLSKLKEIEGFFMKSNWRKSVRRIYIAKKSVKYTFGVRENGVLINKSFLLDLEFFLSILIRLPIESTVDLDFVPAALWIFSTLDRDRYADLKLDYVIPIIHMIWGDEGAKVTVIHGNRAEEVRFLDLIKDAIGFLEKEFSAQVRIYREPLFVVAIIYPAMDCIEARELVLKNCKLFYGIAVSDEGYVDVPQQHAENQLKQWLFSTRRYEVAIASPVSIVFVKYDIDRYEHERFVIPREELEIWFKSYRYIEIYNLFPIEWITFLRVIYRALDEEADRLRKKASEDVEPSEDVIRRLVRLKYIAILIGEALDARNIARIPESFGIFWKLLEYTGAKSLQEYVAVLVREISEIITSEYEELRHHFEMTLNKLMFLLSLFALLDGVLSFIEMLVYEGHALSVLSLPILAIVGIALYYLYIRKHRIARKAQSAHSTIMSSTPNRQL